MKRNQFKPGWAAQILYVLGAYILWTAYNLGTQDLGFGNHMLIVLICFAIATPLFIVGGRLAQRDKRLAQQNANSVAQWTLNRALIAARDGERLPVTLYLRPFALKGHLGYQAFSGGTLTVESYLPDQRQDLEMIVASEFFDTKPLVAVGDVDDAAGAGTVWASEAEWQAVIKQLVQAAERILILPGTTSGLVWEIEWLTECGQIPRCVFLMPPRPLEAEDKTEAHWATASETLAKRGLKLPAYTRDGMLFRFNEYGYVAESRSPLTTTKEGCIAKAMEEVCAGSPHLDALVSQDKCELQKPQSSSVASSPTTHEPPRSAKMLTLPWAVIVGIIFVAVLAISQMRKSSNDAESTDELPVPLTKALVAPPDIPNDVEHYLGEMEPVRTWERKTVLNKVGLDVPSGWVVEDTQEGQIARIHPPTGPIHAQVIAYEPAFNFDPTAFLVTTSPDTIKAWAERGAREAGAGMGVDMQLVCSVACSDTVIGRTQASVSYTMVGTLLGMGSEPIVSAGRFLHQRGVIIQAQVDAPASVALEYKDVIKQMVNGISIRSSADSPLRPSDGRKSDRGK